jgi:uncharacterized tellurite resistance protein B-like protein
MKSEEVLAALIKLSKADNYFDEFEFTYLLKVGKHLGIEDNRVEDLIKNVDITNLTIPQKEEERMTIIYYMLFLMKVDTIIREEEIEVIHHYAFKLGFSAVMIDDFIALMKKNKFKNIAVEDMLSIIKKYHN